MLYHVISNKSTFQFPKPSGTKLAIFAIGHVECGNYSPFGVSPTEKHPIWIYQMTYLIPEPLNKTADRNNTWRNKERW